MTYATLKTDIATWARRSDLTSAIPSFVALAETEIFKTHAIPLRVREMEQETTLTVTSGAATVPSDYLEARYIKLNDADQTSILYMTPEKWNTNQQGFFTVVAGQIRVPNNVTSTLKLVYLARPAALVSDADTNDVLESYYGIYLAASMKYACFHIRDMRDAELYQIKLDDYLDGAARHNKPTTAGSLVVRTA